MMEPNEALAQLAKMVQEAGYKAQIEQTYIKTAASGFMSLLFYYHDLGTLQLYSGFTTPNGFTPNEANSFNSQFRFAKCVLVDDRVGFEWDHHFNVEDADAAARLSRIFSSWDVTLGNASSFLRQIRAA